MLLWSLAVASNILVSKESIISILDIPANASEFPPLPFAPIVTLDPVMLVFAWNDITSPATALNTSTCVEGIPFICISETFEAP